MSAWLFGIIIFAILWMALYFLNKSTRKLQIFGGLLLLPFAILDIWLRPNYWNPPLLIKVIEPLSIESPLYCFLAGGIVAVFGSWFIKQDFKFKNFNIIKTLLFFIIGFLFCYLFSLFTNFPTLNNLNFSFLIIWFFLFVLDVKENWRSLIPGLIFAGFTILAVNLGLLFYPGFVAQYWNLEKLWPLFLRTPVEEILFAGVLGALWTLFPKYLTEESKKKNIKREAGIKFRKGGKK